VAQHQVARAALAYLARGWSVVPIQPRAKRPLLSWEEFQQRLPDASEVRGWFARYPDAGVALVTGALSGLVVLDVDPRHGGEASLREFERQHGALPRSVEAATGGGGRHIYFRHPGGLVRNRVGLAPGLDLRGDGGLVVAPPSVHPSGRRYAWEPGRSPDEIEPAEMPGWFEALARGPRVGRGHALADWRRLVQEGVPEGLRNDSVASLTGHLLWRGVDPELALELLLCWNRVRCRPPLSDDEVVRTVESITRTHRRHLAAREE
jgi:hypothetical protein